MKIGILHLSDIHLSKDETIDHITSKIQIACHFELNDIIKLYIVITGDIANSGKDIEYEKALSFLKELQTKIKDENSFINSIKFVIVPGNHDCLVEEENPVRDTLLQSIKSDDVDIQIANVCLAVQNNFWEFHEKLCGFVPTSKLSYQIEEKLSLDVSLFFNCYNTSWMSIKHEVDNNKIIPVSSLLTNKKRASDIVISIFHHPTSWLSPHTTKKNKKLHPDRVETNKYCKFCKKHTLHKETR